jgi:hypothetical protein
VLTNTNYQPLHSQPPAEMESLIGHKTLNKMAIRTDSMKAAVLLLAKMLQAPPVWATTNSWQPVIGQLRQMLKALEFYLGHSTSVSITADAVAAKDCANDPINSC